MRAVASAVALAVLLAPGAGTALPRFGPVGFLGQFPAGVPGTVIATGGAIAPADFNGDGLVDVAVARALGGTPMAAQDTFPVGILLNDNRGRLIERPGRIFEGPPPRTQWNRQLVVADFNNDGRPDIYLPDTGAEAPNLGPPPGYHDTLVLSTPSGRLRDATAGIPQQSDFTHSGAAADVDSDGDIDIFVGNIGGGFGRCCDVQIWLNDGTGRFTVAADRLPASLGTDNVYLSSAFADVNGDRAQDLVLAGGHGCILGSFVQRNDQLVLLNDGSGYFRVLPGALPQKPFGIYGEGQGVRPADLDRDGRVDLLLAYTSLRQRAPTDCTGERVQGRYIQVLIGNGDGTFRDETATRLPQPDAHEASFDYVQALELADADGDGAAEIFTQLVIPPWGDRIYAAAYRNDGKGRFSPLPRGYPFANREPSVHTLVDLSGQGLRDVVFANFNPRGDVFYKRLQRGKPIRPGTPGDVRVTRDPATGRPIVAWPYVWGAARYEVWRSGRRIAVTRLMRFVDPAPVAGSAYQVRAVNAAGASALSAPAAG